MRALQSELALPTIRYAVEEMDWQRLAP